MTSFALTLWCLVTCISQLQAQTGMFYENAEGGIIDEKIFLRIDSVSKELMEDKATTDIPTLVSQLERTDFKMILPEMKDEPLNPSVLFQEAKPGVLVVATIYRCEHCPNNHIRAASGFVIAEGGIAVTNYHLFKGDATNADTDLAVVVMDVQGNVYPVKEVLAADFNGDVAVFRFDPMGRQLYPLALGADLNPGDDVNIISHPHNMFYSFTRGYLSRYYERNESKKMSITAEFSQGSSGAPVFDSSGNVIGVVSATLSLYNSAEHLQMVSREAIPISKVRALINSN